MFHVTRFSIDWNILGDCVNSRQSTDKQLDVTGVSTVSFTGSCPQMLRSLPRSSLPIQPLFQSNADWCILPFLTHWSWLRFGPFSWSRNWAHGRCDRSTGDVYSSYAPDPTSDVLRGPCLPPFSDLLFPTGLMRSQTVMFSISDI
jgi:hypothetical protein